MSYISPFTIGDILYEDTPNMGTTATPESLRSAAKILEEKAKELEKPKFTERQLKYMNGAYDFEGIILTDDDTNGYWVYSGELDETVMRKVKIASWPTEPANIQRFTIKIAGERLPMVIKKSGSFARMAHIDFMAL